jgi:hypothetical protein
MKMNRIISLLSIVALVAFMSSCSHTRITSTWHDVNEAPQKMDRIGVVVMASSKANRGVIENAFVAEYAKHGITGISTMSIFPRAGEQSENVDREAIEKIVREKVAENNMDGLLIVSLMDVKEDQYYVEGSARYATPYYGGYGYPYHYPISSYPYAGYSYYGYYSHAYSTVYTPGYYVNTTSYFVESSLFDTRSEKLLWTGQTETTDPSSVKKESGFFAEVIVNQMLADRAIEPNQ